MIALVVSGAVAAAGTEMSHPAPPAADDYAAAKLAISDQEWTRAISLLDRALLRDPNNADIYNFLGYAYRSDGDLDRAFANYDRALRINPGHLGAHSYLGIAYLKQNNLMKAEEHLALLKTLCSESCDEYKSLAEAVDEYRRSHS